MGGLCFLKLLSCLQPCKTQDVKVWDRGRGGGDSTCLVLWPSRVHPQHRSRRQCEGCHLAIHELTEQVATGNELFAILLFHILLVHADEVCAEFVLRQLDRERLLAGVHVAKGKLVVRIGPALGGCNHSSQASNRCHALLVPSLQCDCHRGHVHSLLRLHHLCTSLLGLSSGGAFLSGAGRLTSW